MWFPEEDHKFHPWAVPIWLLLQHGRLIKWFFAILMASAALKSKLGNRTCVHEMHSRIFTLELSLTIHVNNNINNISKRMGYAVQPDKAEKGWHQKPKWTVTKGKKNVQRFLWSEGNMVSLQIFVQHGWNTGAETVMARFKQAQTSAQHPQQQFCLESEMVSWFRLSQNELWPHTLQCLGCN